jgi:hypothetical protein
MIPHRGSSSLCNIIVERVASGDIVMVNLMLLGIVQVLRRIGM